MSSRQLKSGYFVLEGLNSFATVYYLWYLPFLMRMLFRFDTKENLTLAAWNGVVCAIGAWQGGKIAQRFGYFFALKAGFLVMLVSLGIGAFVRSAGGHIAVMTVMIIGMCLTWPTLEAMVSEGESPEGVPHMVGIYNIVWAATGALSYFCGGALIDRLCYKSMFYLPATLMLTQLALAFWLERQARPDVKKVPASEQQPNDEPSPKPRPKMFLRMAWLANPFAYIAINTTIAVGPDVAKRLGLSTTLVGFYGSLWCFTRLLAFWGLWKWEGWHYKFRWLLASYIALVGSFILILLAAHLWVLIAAQVFFGLALGLIYSSSLFYSMDLSDTKGEHGGLHEAAIGLGNFAGPAVGAASLHFFPQYANGGVWAVGVLLLVGLGGLIGIRSSGK